jgi:hypothetical protein
MEGEANVVTFTKEELQEALRAIDSTIGKCVKVQPKLKAGTSQHTLLERRIKALRISSELIREQLEIQASIESVARVSEEPEAKSEAGGHLAEYKRLVQTTNLQQGYQEFVKSFRQLRTYLQKALPDFEFTGNIVENNMDYAYFQFSNEALRSKKLKIVVAFVHEKFNCQIWLSGMNREVQTKYYNALKVLNNNQLPYDLTDNPAKTDYILKKELAAAWEKEGMEKVYKKVESAVTDLADFFEKYEKREGR